MNTHALHAACSVFALAGCLAASAASAVPFSSPRGYSLSVPAGWHVQPHLVAGDDANVAVNQKIAVGGRMTMPILQIQFRSSDSPMTSASLEAINQGVLSSVRQHFPDLKVLSQTRLTLGGVPDLDCVFTATTNGIPMRFHEVLVVRHNAASTFTCICPAQIYPRYAAAYAQMLASVHWKS